MVRHLLFLFLASASSQLEHELDYAAALRRQAMHRLAQLHCQRLLDDGDAELSSAERARITIELAKTLTARALNSRPPMRDEYWDQAATTLSAPLNRSTDPAIDVLLRMQWALLALERAEWSRRETEIRGATDEDWEPAREQIREAIRRLKEVETQLAQPQVRGGSPNLSTEQVAELVRNTNYQLSRAYRNQAITYASHPGDRASSLTLALQRLQRIAGDAAVDNLVWQSRVDRVQCFRLRGDLERASQLIAAMSNAPEEFMGRLAAEGVRLALDAKQPQVALNLVQSQADDSSHPELELAKVETFVALVRNSSDASAARKYQQAATEIVARVTQEHGDYWGMRGEMQIASLAASTASDSGLLDAAANTLLKQELPENATDMLILAAQQAEREGDLENAFRYRHKAATVDHQYGNLQAAIDRFRDVAMKYTSNPEASQSHLMAAFDAAALYQQRAKEGQEASATKALAQYEAVMREHLRTWPNQPSADRVRVWLGRLLEAQRDDPAAADMYQNVRPDSPHAVEAYRRLGALYQLQLSKLSEPDGVQLGEAREFFAALISEEVPEATISVVCLELAQLLVFFPPVDYQLATECLDRMNGDASGGSPSRPTANALRVIAMAGTGRMTQAGLLLSRASPLTPTDLTSILKGLELIRDARPEDAGVRDISLEVVKLLKTYRSSLSDEDRLAIHQAVGDAAELQQAIDIYEQLAANHDRHSRVQRRYAELLSTGKDQISRQKALQQWRKVVQQSPPRSKAWFRAKLGVAQSLFDRGQHAQASDLIELLVTLYPDLGGPKLEAAFRSLRDRIEP